MSDPAGPFSRIDDDAALTALHREMDRARRLFPASRMLIEALAEELGEAARDADCGMPGCREWLHVACVAMRLYAEGTPDDCGDCLAIFEAAELLGRRALDVYHVTDDPDNRRPAHG